MMKQSDHGVGVANLACINWYDEIIYNHYLMTPTYRSAGVAEAQKRSRLKGLCPKGGNHDCEDIRPVMRVRCRGARCGSVAGIIG